MRLSHSRPLRWLRHPLSGCHIGGSQSTDFDDHLAGNGRARSGQGIPGQMSPTLVASSRSMVLEATSTDSG